MIPAKLHCPLATFGFALLILAGLCLIATPVFAAEPAADLQAVVTAVQGKYAQASSDAGKTWQPAKKGQKLGKEAQIRTGFASTCELFTASSPGLSMLQFPAAIEPARGLRSR